MAIRKVEIDSKFFEINYEILNPKSKPSIIFLHGWGSNREVMKRAFGNKLQNFQHVYIDLIGFGKSPNSGYILDSFEYSQIIEKFLVDLQISKDIVVGHSYGGKIATLLNPKLLILLSSAGIIEQKPLKVQFKILLFKQLKKLGLDSLRNFFVANDGKNLPQNMYETFKNAVNEDFTETFTNYNGSSLIFWGKNDKATSLQSGKTIANLITKSQFFECEGDHYFFLNNSEFIANKVEEFGRI